MSEPRTADEIIKGLSLKPNPEGGWFRETFRDEKDHGDRAHSTAILYLLKAGEVARCHRVTQPRYSIGTAGRRCCSKSRTARHVTNTG